MTIPQEVLDKINSNYPLGNGGYSTSFRGFNKLQEAKRIGAEFGYGLSEERIKELEELTIELRNAYQNYVGVLAQEVFELRKFIKKHQLSDEWLQTWQAQEVDDLGIKARKNLAGVLSKIQPKPPKDI